MAVTRVVDPGASDDLGTRGRVLQLIASEGPISASALAHRLELTPTAVRRHLAELSDTGQIVVHEAPPAGPLGRGRPARRYVATSAGQAGLAQGYADLALDLLGFLESQAGTTAVTDFAQNRAERLGARLAPVVRGRSEVADRAGAVAVALDHDGFAATVRPVVGVGAIQLCLGHCPVQEVAERFPQLCDAETQVLSEVLGVHVLRLSTLASGDHVCTTHVPTGQTAAGSSLPEGQRP